jgi:hypothetical protein
MCPHQEPSDLSRRDALRLGGGFVAAAALAACTGEGGDRGSARTDRQRRGARSTTAAGPQPSTATQPGYRASLYDTTWPVDMANLNRSNTVVDAGLPRDATSRDVSVETVEMPFPVFAYTRDEAEIFVVGGTPLITSNYVAAIDGQPAGTSPLMPHLTRLDTGTGKARRLDLDRGSGLPYIGGALVHANGFVYVVSQAHLYKVDPDTLRIVRSVDLPVPAASPTGAAFNGLTAAASGALITKSFSLAGGGSTFLLLDPGMLETINAVDYPGASPRLTVARASNGVEYLYHLNRSDTFRFRIEESSLTLDQDWIAHYDPYETGATENEEPTSPVVVDGRVYYTTNTTFTATRPMRIFWQDIASNYSPNDPPLIGPPLFTDDRTPGWSFFHLAVDDLSGTVVGHDQASGRLTAVRAHADGTIRRLWERRLRVSARPMIVADRKMVYATDYVDGRNHLVALDLITGKDLLRIATPATRATIATIVANRSDVFFGSNEPGRSTGLFHRFHVT